MDDLSYSFWFEGRFWQLLHHFTKFRAENKQQLRAEAIHDVNSGGKDQPTFTLPERTMGSLSPSSFEVQQTLDVARILF